MQSHRSRNLSIESLEERRVLATFIVNDAGDDQGLTLRHAVEMANVTPGSDLVVFDAALAGERIQLTAGDIPILDDLRIDASDLSAPITVDASGNDLTPEIDDQMGSRIFTIDDGLSSNISVGILGLTLTGGDVMGSGGAIYSSELLELTNVELIDNHASMHGGGLRLVAEEGAMLGFNGHDVRIADNRAGVNGGGISTNGWATVQTLEDSVISDNQAGGDGGGLHLPGALHWINRTQIANNGATNGGAIYFSNEGFGGDLIVRNSTIAFNAASQDGGGVFAQSDGALSELPVGLSFNQVTVSQNASGRSGGGFFVDVSNDVTFLLERSTVVQNVANTSLSAEPATGGGLHGVGDATRLVGRSALADNSRLTGNDESTPDDLSGDIFADRSLIEANPGQFVVDGTENLFGLPPDLSDLADHGGPTLTHVPNSRSPLIDAAGPAVFVGSATDQRGLLRVIDGTGDGNAVADIGAVERQSGNTAPTANAGADAVARVAVPFPLDGSASFDPDDDGLSYEWRVLQTTYVDEIVVGDIPTAFDDSNSATPLFTVHEPAVYEIELTVSDGFAADSDIVIIEAVRNEVPFASATTASLVASLRFPVELDGRPSTDSDPLTYAWSVIESPTGSAFEFDDPTASVAALTADTPGEYTVQLIVDDGIGSSAPFTFTVMLEDTIQAGGPYALIAGNDLQLYGPTRFVSAPDGIGQVSWDINNDGSYTDVQGNAPLISWSTLESLLGPDPVGIFPISAENFVGAGNFTRHHSMLTIFPAGLPEMTSGGAYGLTGDIDGDGDIDAVGKRTAIDVGQSYFNDGQGNFTSLPASNDSLLFSQVSALTDADLDGDLDLITTPGVKPTTLSLNDGTGYFTPVSEFATENSMFGQVHVSDANNDGAPDVFVADIGSVQLYLNDGSGNLLFDRTLFASHPDQDVELGEIRDLVFADFNGDRFEDALIERLDGSKDFWLGQPDGQFAWSVSDTSSLPSLAGLLDRPADLDSDQDLDWVGINGRIYRQDASGRFFDVDFVDTLLEVRAVADINNDGHVDVVAEFDNPAAFIDNNELQVYLNDGLGTFTASFPLGLTLDLANNSAFLLEDFDADGQLDLLKSDVSANNSEIWFNNILPGSWHNSLFAFDVNAGGQVSPLDPLLVINELNDREYSTEGTGILAVAPADVAEFVDINNDGLVAPIDALMAINALTDPEAGPILGALPDVIMRAGSPLAVPLDGNVLEGVTVSYSASSSRPIVSTWIPEGNRSLVIDVDSPGNGITGQMKFQLFENYVPRVTDRIIQLAQSGFYDGLTFHRILDDFVIQGGDPNGNGTGGSTLPDFDDQFHPHLQHNQTGILSMAKMVDDTNNSQFFITENASRHLDFNHSIFGFLVEGEATREAVSNVAANPSGQPTQTVFMENVDVILDRENRVLFLDAPEGFAGTADITVTASVNGDSLSRTFQVTVIDDNFNSDPYLEDIPAIATPINTQVTYQLRGIDVEEDPVVYFGPDEASPLSSGFPVMEPPGDVAVVVDETTGLLTITPTNDYTGTFEITVGVSAFTFRINDFQTILVTVGD